jgi:hypothetical protein
LNFLEGGESGSLPSPKISFAFLSFEIMIPVCVKDAVLKIILIGMIYSTRTGVSRIE